MRSANLRELHREGWQIGDEADFLQLTPEEARLVKLRTEFCRAIKKRRKEKNITQSALALILQTSQPAIVRMESCSPSVSLDFIMRAYFALGGNLKDIGQSIINLR